MNLRIIGDVHGCIDTPHPKKKVSYRHLVENAKYSIQLGDMGFNYAGLMYGLDPLHHVFLPGNHDNYDNLPVHALGDYGLLTFGVWTTFFVQGEWSIDIKQRQKYEQDTGIKIWWENEELSPDQMRLCLECYTYAKPDVVVSHTCPASISSKVGSPDVWGFFGWDEPQVSKTQTLLQNMYEVHQPKLWLFGHFHRNWFYTEKNTDFICIDELSALDFDEDWKIV
jgi:hypothetical protein